MRRAPAMAVAEAKGFFAKHGLDEVQLVRETSWRGVTDGLLDRTLDGALMPSGMPTWMTAGGHGGDGFDECGHEWRIRSGVRSRKFILRV